MKVSLLKSAAALWLAGLLLAAVAPAGPAVGQTAAEAFDNAFNAWAAANPVTEAVLVVRYRGRVITKRAIGRNPDSPVRLASVSKAVTGACVATLVRDSRLGFDTPLSVALRNMIAVNGWTLAPGTAAITVGQLLTHRSGLHNNGSGDPTWGKAADVFLHRTYGPNDVIPAGYVALQLNAPFTSVTGAKYDYSNAGYVVLGAIIEEVSGRPYDAYCRDAVLTPMGSVGAIDPDTRLWAPGGTWWFSAENYLRFYQIFDSNDPILGQVAKAFMQSPAGKTTSGGAWYGLGTLVRKVSQGYNIWHSGALDGFSTNVAKLADGAEWFQYVYPGTLGPKLDGAVYKAYESVKNWN